MGGGFAGVPSLFGRRSLGLRGCGFGLDTGGASTFPLKKDAKGFALREMDGSGWIGKEVAIAMPSRVKTLCMRVASILPRGFMGSMKEIQT